MNRMYRRKPSHRIAAGLMAVCMTLLTPLPALARTTQEVEAEQAELEQEHQELEAELERLREDESQKQEYQETLEKQINVLVNQINTARNDIEELNANIQVLDMKIEASAEEAADTIEKFKQRVAALYRAGSVSTLEILLKSNSFSDFSMRSEMLSNMSRHDQELLDKIQAYMDATRDERQEREAQKAMVADLKKGLESKQKELDALYEENAAAIAELQEAQGATQGAIAENESRAEDLTAELQALIEEQKRKEEEERKRREEAAAANQPNSTIGATGQGEVTYAPGGTGGVDGFHPCWPLPGVTYISDEYMGSGGYRIHRGMDIAGPAMTEIVAAESGTVIRAWTQDTWGMGWGYHVYIYHNETYCTLYAHMNQVAVSEGQYVTQGQVIGYEGSTGDSTGPHLHFEVWENGDRVNPRNFL